MYACMYVCTLLSSLIRRGSPGSSSRRRRRAGRRGTRRTHGHDPAAAAGSPAGSPVAAGRSSRLVVVEAGSLAAGSPVVRTGAAGRSSCSGSTGSSLGSDRRRRTGPAGEDSRLGTRVAVLADRRCMREAGLACSPLSLLLVVVVAFCSGKVGWRDG